MNHNTSLPPVIAAGLSLFLIFFVTSPGQASGDSSRLHSISIIAPAELLTIPVAKTAVEDSLALLRKGFPQTRITLNDAAAQVKIVLPAADPSLEPPHSSFAEGRNYHYLEYPAHGYRWRSQREETGIVLRLATPSAQGVSCALYGLLQEKLGFKFYHPRRTLFPCHGRWPLPAHFCWSGQPRFDKKGFHLHTQHPTELSEQLNKVDFPHALDDVKEYLDWLTRNQQNTVQFYLLREVDRRRWMAHARQIVEYAHGRGILIGVHLSLSMLQQEAFQTIHLLQPIPSYRQQIDRNLAWLFQARWDFITVDFTMGEYLPNLGRIVPGIKNYLVEQITGKYRTKLFYVTHVIRAKGETAAAAMAFSSPVRTSGQLGNGAGAGTGILIHTVMCYSISESMAPVYGNRNQCFALERAILESRRQEVWYWPESAYWVGFDNSVPLFLLPYLEARWSDMNTMQNIGVASHLTFSSGWEWGYWLMDWSIARWSWRYSDNGKIIQSSPLNILDDLFPAPRMQRLWREALALQDRYLKERELLKYMAALPPSAELPWPFDSPFQPVPEHSYSWLLHKASDREAGQVLKGPVADLDAYADKMEQLVTRLERETARRFPESSAPERRLLAEELNRGLQVSALRARHRALTIKALLAQRGKSRWWQKNSPATTRFLAEAAAVRRQGLALVRQQEQNYRYPVSLVARPRESLTAYHFGYLYPVNTLFFWKREEEQIRHRRFDAFYMNIWNFRKIVGLESLFF